MSNGSLPSDPPPSYKPAKKDPTRRFSDRVNDYIKYRPSYPTSVITELQRASIITPTTLIADIGSGTGKFTELLLPLGNSIYAVEPNDEMRGAAERLFTQFSNFTSVAGSAEVTTLAPHSVDLIIVAQALHWFRLDETLHEFRRILTPSGKLAVIWNQRCTDTTPFLHAYEQLLFTYCPEYRESPHLEMDERTLFSYIDAPHCHQFEDQYVQHFDYIGLEGRLRSSSYTPSPQDPLFSPLIKALHQIFTQYQHNGMITFEYRTLLYYGPLNRVLAI